WRLWNQAGRMERHEVLGADQLRDRSQGHRAQGLLESKPAGPRARAARRHPAAQVGLAEPVGPRARGTPSNLRLCLLGRVSQRRPGKNFHLVRKYEGSGSVLEANEVHMTVEIVYFLDYLDALGKADMTLVISHWFE